MNGSASVNGDTENRDKVVILDAGAQYGKVRTVMYDALYTYFPQDWIDRKFEYIINCLIWKTCTSIRLQAKSMHVFKKITMV